MPVHLLKYDTVVSTSDFFTDLCFREAFSTKDIFVCGYPRNDVLFEDADEKNYIGTDKNTFETIKEHKNNSYKIILYAPTFRDKGGDAFVDNTLNLEELSKYLEKRKFILCIKMHTIIKDKNQRNYENIIFYKNSADIYPVLPHIDLLITDYSSIYFDYLLLDKPVLFFPYDLDTYINLHRELNFPYDSATPGYKAYNQEELLSYVDKILLENDLKYADERGELKIKSFNYIDGNSSKRLYEYICAKFSNNS